MSRKIELVFAALFALFFIFWLTFDLPVALGLATSRLAGTRGRSNRLPPSAIVAEGYRLVPVRVRPLLLQTAYGFFRSTSWLPYLLLPLAGMVVASTAIYMAINATGDVPPSNWTMFYLFNGPYIVVPAVAAIWVIVRTRKAVTPGTSASA